PHDYPLAVVALTLSSDLVPPEQLTDFRTVVRGYLEASLDGHAGTPEGEAMIRELEARVVLLSDPSQAIAAAILRRDVRAVGAAVAPYTGPFGRDTALSPA